MLVRPQRPDRRQPIPNGVMQTRNYGAITHKGCGQVSGTSSIICIMRFARSRMPALAAACPECSRPDSSHHDQIRRPYSFFVWINTQLKAIDAKGAIVCRRFLDRRLPDLALSLARISSCAVRLGDALPPSDRILTQVFRAGVSRCRDGRRHGMSLFLKTQAQGAAHYPSDKTFSG